MGRPLGLVPGNCQIFHFPLFYFITSNMSTAEVKRFNILLTVKVKGGGGGVVSTAHRGGCKESFTAENGKPLSTSPP